MLTNGRMSGANPSCGSEQTKYVVTASTMGTPAVNNLHVNEFDYCRVTFCISFVFCDNLFLFICDLELYDECPF